MALSLKKATKEQAYLRAAFHGPAGSGKTKTALRVSEALLALLCPDKRVRLIDTERGSASKYAGAHDFDVIEVFDDYGPERLNEAIDLACSDGECGVLVIDSTSHFWNGPGGILEFVDKEAKRLGQSRGGKADSYSAWNAGDKLYRRMVQKITGAPTHVIMTLRAKQDYVRDEKTNKIEKKGFAPEVRQGFEYEADLEGALDMGHNLVIGKTRFDSLDGKEFFKPGRDLAEILARELRDGTARKPPAPQPPAVIAEQAQRVANAAARPVDLSAVENAPDHHALLDVCGRLKAEHGQIPELVAAYKKRASELENGAAA